MAKQAENSPAVINNDLAKVVKKEDSLFDEIKGEMLASTVEALLPKIQPFIGPALEEFYKFLGNNEKLIVIRKIEGLDAMVIIFDNKKGYYTIEMDNVENIEVFEASKESIHSTYNISEFLTKLLTGELMKEMKAKK